MTIMYHEGNRGLHEAFDVHPRQPTFQGPLKT